METDQAKAPATAPKEDKPAPAPPKPQDQLRSIVVLLENAVKLKETRLLSGRILRLTAAVRKHLTADLLRTFGDSTLSSECELKLPLLQILDEVRARARSARCTPEENHCKTQQANASTDVSLPRVYCNKAVTCATCLCAQVKSTSDTAMDTDAPEQATTPATAPTPSSTPEVEMYAVLLVLMLLLDNKRYEQVCDSACHRARSAVLPCSPRR